MQDIGVLDEQQKELQIGSVHGINTDLHPVNIRNQTAQIFALKADE